MRISGLYTVYTGQFIQYSLCIYYLYQAVQELILNRGLNCFATEQTDTTEHLSYHRNVRKLWSTGSSTCFKGHSVHSVFYRSNATVFTLGFAGLPSTCRRVDRCFLRSSSMRLWFQCNTSVLFWILVICRPIPISISVTHEHLTKLFMPLTYLHYLLAASMNLG